MAIEPLIDGETAVQTVQWFGPNGTVVPASEITVAGAWTVAGVTPPTPAAEIYDANTWIVIASSTGMGGRSAVLRLTATRTATGEVLIRDTQYLVVE